MAKAQRSEITEAVRSRYAAAARSLDLNVGPGSACCGEGCGCSPTDSAKTSQELWGKALYQDELGDLAPEAAFLASLGCGNPTEVAELREGEVVLDLGSGAGLDVFLSARRVGPSGKAFGLDMTDEMLARARDNQRRAGITNAEFLKGYIEDIPLPANSVDVVISNCVINLSADKGRVFEETFRVLKPGGRLGISDVVADGPSDSRLSTEFDAESWSACLTGALLRDEYEAGLRRAGFIDVYLKDSHKVADGYASAIIRARKPEKPSGEGR